MNEILTQFPFGLLVDVVNILQLLPYKKITTEEFIHAINNQKADNIAGQLRQEQKQAQRRDCLQRIMPSCPLCSNMLILKPIRTRQGKANINGYKSHFYCSNDDCLYERYSRVSAEYQYKKLLKKRKEGK